MGFAILWLTLIKQSVEYMCIDAFLQVELSCKVCNFMYVMRKAN